MYKLSKDELDVGQYNVLKIYYRVVDKTESRQKQDFKKIAGDFLDIYYDADQYINKNEKGFAAGLFYVASILLGEPVTQKAAAELFSTSQNMVTAAFKELLGGKSKEQVLSYLKK